VLAILVFASALPPIQCIDGASPSSPRAEPSPPWAVGSRWTWTVDQDLAFCITISGATIRITHVKGDMKDTIENLTTFNGTAVYRVDAIYSETLTGTLTVFGFPTPISWPVTGNGTFLYRIPDLAVVYQYQHVTIDMGALIGTFTADTSTVANPPVESYRFPIDVQNAWRVGSDLTVWTRTSGAGNAFETTSNDRLDADGSVPRMQDATVPAGTFSCFNITYNGTYTSGSGAPTPENSSALYSPKVTNVMYRDFSPMAGMNVAFSLSSYSLNRAPAVASSVPDVTFPEDTTGTLDLATVFSDDDKGDRLGFVVSNFTNITTSVDNSTGIATFVPPRDWSGTERIVFTAKDAKGAVAATSVNVTVTPQNDAPVLVRLLPAIIMDEDTLSDTLNLSQYFDDADFAYGDNLAFSFKDNGSIGEGISPSGIVSLRPFENWSGVENITIIATDTAGSWAGGLLKVAVLNTPDAPVIVATSHEFTFPEDTPLVVDLSQRFHDADLPYGDRLAFAVEDVTTGFDYSIDDRTGLLDLAPPKDWSGTTTMGFVVTDGTGQNATERVKVTVTSVNDIPRMTDSQPAKDAVTLAENTSTRFSVTASDADSPDLEFSWFLDGNEVASGGWYIYQAGFSSAGPHNLTAEVSDGLARVSRTWNLTVTNVNRPAENVSIVSPASGTKFPLGGKVNLTGAATDPDDDPLTFSWKDTNGRLLGTGRIFETRSLTKGKHVITLEVSDGNTTVPASVTLSVVPPPEQRTPGFGIFSLLLAGALTMLAVKKARRGERDAAAPKK